MLADLDLGLACRAAAITVPSSAFQRTPYARRCSPRRWDTLAHACAEPEVVALFRKRPTETGAVEVPEGV
jgi:hypothetical protein